jgi:hypothetical protein
MDRALQPRFTPFRRLPFEIQSAVWQLTIEPRIIFCQKHTRNAIPAILHTCQESREEGLLHYQLINFHPASRSPIYFNIACDTLFSASTSIQGRDWNLDFLNDSPAVGQVQHLALSQSFWERLNWNPAYIFLVDRIRSSKVLQSVTIVSRDKGVFPRDGIRLVDAETEGLREGLEDWRLELEQSREDFPDWNLPELKFALLERI